MTPTEGVEHDAPTEVATEQPMRRQTFFRLLLRICAIGAVVVLGLFFVSIVVWQIDTRFISHERLRHETLSGYNIASYSQTDIKQSLERKKSAIEKAQITVISGKSQAITTLSDLDLSIDSAQTAKYSYKNYADKSLPEQYVSWFSNWFNAEMLPLYLHDGGGFHQQWDGLALPDVKSAIEPNIVYSDGKYVATKGKEGNGIALSQAREQLALGLRDRPVTIEITPKILKPTHTNDEAEALAEQANTFTGPELLLSIGGQSKKVTSETYGKWFTARGTEDKLQLDFDADSTTAGLHDLFADVGNPARNAQFVVSGNTITISPEARGTTCCGTASLPGISDAVFHDGPPSIGLALAVDVPTVTAEYLASLGVTEEVSTFTTRHPAGAPRVRNIHRIADLIRGQVIAPGNTFSVNEFVGKRTVAKGFVVDHVIENGKFSEAVGGGISQFATTLFNASFFAGLDIPAYKAHSIYISRYPYGREATLSYPQPDLKIHNNTKYGVLIWPQYTGSSITVNLFSTKTFNADQTGQTTAQKGKCTVVRTERTRTNVATQKQEKDYFRAIYQPGEGITCG